MTRLPTSGSVPISTLLSQRPAPLSIIFASHARWPLSPDSPRSESGPSSERPLSITVLDSSFNPPHAAHRALGETSTRGTDAQLLAFSLTNADKQLDQKDLHHRLEMMRAMAIDLHRGAGGRPGNGKWNNVAVAVLDAATFVKKSQVLNSEIKSLLREEHALENAEPEFEFAVGKSILLPWWDTLIRIFATRYYPRPGPDLATSMDTFLSTNRSSLVCARRGSTAADTASFAAQEEDEFMSRDEVDKWVRRGNLRLVDLEDESVRTISSTEIRAAVKAGEWDRVEQMVPFPSVIDVIKRERLYLG